MVRSEQGASAPCPLPRGSKSAEFETVSLQSAFYLAIGNNPNTETGNCKQCDVGEHPSLNPSKGTLCGDCRAVSSAGGSGTRLREALTSKSDNLTVDIGAWLYFLSKSDT